MGTVESHVWTYPSRAARLILGSARPMEVAAAVKELAATYDDTKHMVPRVNGIVNVVLSGALPMESVRHRKRFERHLEELASESYGAAVNWYAAQGKFCRAAIFVWIARLCCCSFTKAMGFSSSIRGLSEYSLFGPRHREELHLLLEMCRDLLRVLDWEDIFDLMVLYCCLGVVATKTAEVEDNVDTRFGATSDSSTVQLALDSWWDPSTHHLTALGADHFDIEASGPAPRTNSGSVQRKDVGEAKRLFTSIVRRLLETQIR